MKCPNITTIYSTRKSKSWLRVKIYVTLFGLIVIRMTPHSQTKGMTGDGHQCQPSACSSSPCHRGFFKMKYDSKIHNNIIYILFIRGNS